MKDEVVKVIIVILFTVVLIGWLGFLTSQTVTIAEKQYIQDVKVAVLQQDLNYIKCGIDEIKQELKKKDK